MRKWETLRFGIVLCGLSILYLLLIARLSYWQVIRAEELKKIGQNQSSQTLKIPSLRGQIFTNDNFPIVSNRISYLLYANPKVISDKKETSLKLSKILDYDESSLSALLDQELFWVKIEQNLDQNKKKEIESQGLKGLGFQQEFSRFYPEASLAAHLIGFVGKDSLGNDKGYFGIEGRYNDQLEGRAGALYVIRDALGNQILNDIREDKKIDGRSLKLTIDRIIQFSADEVLKEGVEKYDADGGSVIVMDSKTGAILVMASYPRFDPKKYYEYDASTYKNPVLSSLYEPGSTFKVLVMAAAIDSKLVKPETKCNICAGPIDIGEYKIKTWNDKYFPGTTMNDVIIHSDNTGMVYVGKKLGVNNFVKYLKRFGFGEPTGIDLQGEATGEVRDEKSWYPIDLGTASFGQGISITPIQLLVAVNTVASGGDLLTPFVVAEIITEDGKKIKMKSENRGKVISASTAKTITNMMVNAVENGEAKWTKIKNYKIAGKTGTAQIPVSGHYDPNQTIASFVGFFPASNPKVTMLVLLNRPKKSIYGSETAAPIFFSIARDIIKYYNLPSQ